MVFKIFKVIWIISLLAVCGVFFYAYSSMQDQVSLGMGQGGFSKTLFFYVAVSVIALFNGLSFTLFRMIELQWKKTWYYGLLITLHLFLSSVFIFLAILNSNEKYDYSNLGPTVIGSLVIFFGWIITYPLVPFFHKTSNQ